MIRTTRTPGEDREMSLPTPQATSQAVPHATRLVRAVHEAHGISAAAPAARLGMTAEP